jgi:hypothetical protein
MYSFVWLARRGWGRRSGADLGKDVGRGSSDAAAVVFAGAFGSGAGGFGKERIVAAEEVA